MKIVYDEDSLELFVKSAILASPEHPVLIDKFLEDAIEVDVDAVADGKACVIAGVMEHIEQAGIHSGDSASILPPHTLSKKILTVIKENTCALARDLNVIGLMNVQFAVKGDTVYVLEVNPRASRTVPFVSKATGIPWAKIASKVMVGKNLSDLGITTEVKTEHISVKESVFPFKRFIGVDPVLGPEMKSTGEVMGIDRDLGIAFAKSQIAAGQVLPLRGSVFISTSDKDKADIAPIAKQLSDLGFSLVATAGTAGVLTRHGLLVKEVHKVSEGRPSVVDLIKSREIDLVINTPTGRNPKADESSIRSTAVQYNIPYITTIAGAKAAVNGIKSLLKGELSVKSLQEYHKNSE